MEEKTDYCVIVSPAEAIYPNSDLYKFLDNEIIVDCGAFTGDTIKEIIKYFPRTAQTHSFEPDLANFKKLVAFVDGGLNATVTCYDMATGSSEGDTIPISALE